MISSFNQNSGDDDDDVCFSAHQPSSEKGSTPKESIFSL